MQGYGGSTLAKISFGVEGSEALRIVLSRAANFFGGNQKITFYIGDSGEYSADENLTHLRVNRDKYGRDPWHLTPVQANNVMAKMSFGFKRALRSRDRQDYNRAVEAAANAVIAAFKSNIANHAYTGKHKDLTEKYKKQKAKKHGSEYPILVASGSLLNSIRYKVTK